MVEASISFLTNTTKSIACFKNRIKSTRTSYSNSFRVSELTEKKAEKNTANTIKKRTASVSVFRDLRSL